MIKKLKENLPISITVGPTIVWLGLFILIPLIYVLGISFLTKSPYGGVIFKFNINNYLSLVNMDYMKVFIDSLWLSLETTIICLVLGYPFAYIIANVDKHMKAILLVIIMLPFWTNSLIRTYGWSALLREQGIINNILLHTGLINKPIEMLYTDGSTLLGMVYALLPFMILPLYTSIEKLDDSLIEAASDLGATKFRTLIRVILPLTMPGVFAGSIQTFIPSLGFFFISDMMGGGKKVYIGNLIKNQFLSARNWPLGAVISIMLILFTLIVMKLYSKVGSLEDMA